MRQYRGLVAIGTLTALAAAVLPVFGLVAIAIGVVAIVKGRVKAGVVIIAIGFTLGVASTVVYTVVLRPYRVPSQAMAPTIDIGDRVLVARGSDADRGEVAVFHPPAGADANVCGVRHPEGSACPRPTGDRSDTNFIKRVVAVGGDRLKVVDGRVYVNGRLQDEPFARADSQCGICNLRREIIIPKGHYFMMGDNRGESADSREWGPIPENWMIGKGFATYWPPGRIGGL
jgi:signal peptidase I